MEENIFCMNQQKLDYYLLHYHPIATIAGSSFIVISAKTQFLDQVGIISTSQLINGISKLLQKLLKCFSGITTSAFVNESLFCGIFPVILVLYLKDSELEE